MTTDEAKRIYERLFVAYPHLRKYVTDLDQHAQATFDAWKQMLSDVPHDLADECVTRAISGVLDVPAKPWDVALLPGWIRQQVGRMQAARRNAAKVHGTRSLVAEMRANRGRDNLADLIDASLVAGDMYHRGEIDEATNRQIVAMLVAQNADPKKPAQIPDVIFNEWQSIRRKRK
jgi:hypothetical protein